MIKKRLHKINGEVRFPQVRLIREGQEPIITTSYDASIMARNEGKDLILITETANPPVVKIEDYQKFLYNIEKQAKERRKNVQKNELKEIQLSCTIADNDLNTKSKKAIEFLEDGDKVKCVINLKGRQRSMPTQGELVMLKFAQLLEEYGYPESLPKLEGSRWLMLVKPKKK